MQERTLVLLKPDAVKRHISGKIISRFEDTGLKIVGVKMVWASEELTKRHYPLDEQWAKNVFEKTKSAYEKDGKKFKYKTYIEFGKTIQKWNADFLKEGPVIAMVLEGPQSIEIVRKMIGSTEPKSATPGTIRGDFSSVEAYSVADSKSRVLRNLVHASDSKENAEREIQIWFKLEELHEHKTAYDFLF